MTDEQLATRAQAGDRAAMNILLTRHEPYIRRMVARALRQAKRLFDVREDALQVGRMAFWRCIKAWDPAVAPLEVFAWKPIQNAVWDEAAHMGHGAKVRFGKKAPSVTCLDAPIGEDDDSPPLVASFVARNPDASALVDAERILGQLTEREADLLYRVAVDDGYPEIGADYGVTRQRVQQWYASARERAERIANGMIRRAA